MPKENSETIRTMGAVFAVVLSIVTLEISSYLTRQANTVSRESHDYAKLALANAEKGDLIAKEALALSNTVNDTVLGLTREYPNIDVRMATTTPILIQSLDDLRIVDFQLYVKNRGNVPVIGLLIHLSAVNGVVHAVDDPDDICAGLESMAFEVLFDELLMPQGFAFVDLRGPALDYLQSIGAGFRFPDRIYHTPVNVMVTPMVGDEPVQTSAPNTPCGDQDLFQARYMPSLLKQPAAIEITNAIPVRSKVFSPPPESMFAESLGSGLNDRPPVP